MEDIYRNISTWKKPLHKTRAQVTKWWVKINPQAEIIGVTGSVGKTTTKEAIASVLSQKFSTVASIGNLDPVFNIPITLLKVRPWTKKVVLELGVEYPNEMDFYLSLVQPNIGVVTRVYWAHTEFLGDIQGVINEKSKLLKKLPEKGWAVLNHDDEYIREEMAKRTKAHIFSFGTHPYADLQVSDFLHQGKDGSAFKIKSKLKEFPQETKISWKLLGEHNTVAAAAAACVGLLSGLSPKEIKVGLEKLKPQPHRLNPVAGPSGSLILDDTYNSSPAAAMMALETLRALANKGRAIAVLGEMKELGKYIEEGHREVGRKAAQENIDKLILYGEKTRFTGEEARKNGLKKDQITDVSSAEKIVEILKKELKRDDVCLIKASRHHIHLERVVLGLEDKPMVVDCLVCPEFRSVR